MELENRLSELLETSVGDLQPPVAEMVVEANRLGGRRRARRRIQLAATVVVVAAVATTGTVIGLDRRGPGPDTSMVAAGQPKPLASASPTATPTPTATAEIGSADMTWQAMLKILADELPPGGTFANLDTFAIKFNARADDRYLQVEYNDGQGASTLMLDMSRGRRGFGLKDCSGWTGGSDEGPRKPGYETPTCSQTTLSDGSTLFSYITGTDVVGLYDESVVLTRPDGVTIHVTAANATLDIPGSPNHGITVTRLKPPLGLQGWQRVVESPKWQFKVPESTVDAGAAFAKNVSRFPCPVADKSQCAD